MTGRRTIIITPKTIRCSGIALRKKDSWQWTEEITQEGNLLIIGGKRYTKVEDVDLSF
jgi:hypothetical protein